MKYFLFFGLTLFAFLFEQNAQAQEEESEAQFKVITTVESIVPGGIGRSRMIEEKTPPDYTPERDKNGKIKRRDLKINNYNETKMLNFYSAVGINFKNIASNDALISSMLYEMVNDGWELLTIVSGVESDAGQNDGNGIFITRYYFKR